MGIWNFYFLAKLYLHLRGHIAFHLVPNGLFFAYLMISGERLARVRPVLARIRPLLGLPIALALLWHDAYVPPFTMVFSFMTDSATRPTPGYLSSFLLGYWNPAAAAALALILAVAAWCAKRKIRLAPVTLALMLAASLKSMSRTVDVPAAQEDLFYLMEERQRVPFKQPSAGAKPFDIIILHVCSISWDDLKRMGMESDLFLSNFDLLLTRFNSVASYSNPAAIRLLRGACGQSPHDALYREAPAGCYLLEELRRQGYATYTLFNHDGSYSDMAKSLAELGKADPPFPLKNPPVVAKNFDGASIFNDYAVLEEWWRARQAGGAPRAALYYNSISLHDGAHALSDGSWWKRERCEKYRGFIQRLFADLSKFIPLVQQSGRDALIVFIPEHGAALAGSRIQAKGLRDIPLPDITLVPVGIRVVARDASAAVAAPRRVDRPLSYRALAYLFSQALQGPGLSREKLLSARSIASIPQTAFLAENQYARVAAHGGRYLYQGKDKTWMDISAEAGSESAGPEAPR
ncbi:MAG: cellulose biosynthesis protein BcsG [Elusimicrobia bacterium]|nr:cellulose biosynthesis protein BcsG [Elusimicrobiota bacterium]